MDRSIVDENQERNQIKETTILRQTNRDRKNVQILQADGKLKHTHHLQPLMWTIQYSAFHYIHIFNAFQAK